MNRMPLAAILAVVVLQSVPPRQASQSKNSDNTASANPKHLVEISPSPLVVQSKKDTWDIALVCLTGVLVFVAGVQIFFLWGTVKATQANADAARKSAEAVINSERAWLLMEHIGPLQKPEIGQGFYSCPVVLRNFGKTPAKVVAVQMTLHMMREGEIPSDTLVANNETPVVPVIIAQNLDMPHYVRSSISTSFDIRDRRNVLWLRGSVKYEDVFRQEPIHETRFCHIFEDRNEGIGMFPYMAGPAEYNRTT